MGFVKLFKEKYYLIISILDIEFIETNQIKIKNSSPKPWLTIASKKSETLTFDPDMRALLFLISSMASPHLAV